VSSKQQTQELVQPQTRFNSWFTRFRAVVRYEMIWNIRKKKFIGIIVIAFLLSTLGLVLPLLLSSEPIEQNANFAITYSAGSFAFFLFALATAMNSISSEFESGSIVPLLTKPVSRTTVFLGKLAASFIIILVSFVIIFTYTTVGSMFIYGPQSNLELVPLILVGNLVSTFIWVSILLAMGALTKNTILTVIIALGLFFSLFIAMPIASVFVGPSPTLNYLPGNGATGSLLTPSNTTISISTGTDNLGTNIVYALLYPGEDVTFGQINLDAVQSGDTSMPILETLYTEPIGYIALRGLATALIYTIVFLLIGWFAFKKTQINE
jgi:ABC-type transport system involved in multi-copper enzyme maturation permease subunit